MGHAPESFYQKKELEERFLKHYLIDTNVVIDMLLGREGVSLTTIITRNKKDFKLSSLKVIDSVEFLYNKRGKAQLMAN